MSVHRGGSASVHAGIPPPGTDTPGSRHPPADIPGRHLRQTPPWHTPCQTPPERRPLLRTVRILLEFILVFTEFIEFSMVIRDIPHLVLGILLDVFHYYVWIGIYSVSINSYLPWGSISNVLCILLCRSATGWYLMTKSIPLLSYDTQTALFTSRRTACRHTERGLEGVLYGGFLWYFRNYTRQTSGTAVNREVGCFVNTGRERLIRSHLSARFCFELSGNSN